MYLQQIVSPDMDLCDFRTHKRDVFWDFPAGQTVPGGPRGFSLDNRS